MLSQKGLFLSFNSNTEKAKSISEAAPETMSVTLLHENIKNILAALKEQTENNIKNLLLEKTGSTVAALSTNSDITVRRFIEFHMQIDITTFFNKILDFSDPKNSIKAEVDKKIGAFFLVIKEYEKASIGFEAAEENTAKLTNAIFDELLIVYAEHLYADKKVNTNDFLRKISLLNCLILLSKNDSDLWHLFIKNVECAFSVNKKIIPEPINQQVNLIFPTVASTKTQTEDNVLAIPEDLIQIVNKKISEAFESYKKLYLVRAAPNADLESRVNEIKGLKKFNEQWKKIQALREILTDRNSDHFLPLLEKAVVDIFIHMMANQLKEKEEVNQVGDKSLKMKL